MNRAAVVIAGTLSLSACEPDKPVVPGDDSGLARRVPERSETNIRALDHEIHSEGIGPYLLGAPLRDTLARLPHGPRIELLPIDALADIRLVRAEQDRIAIGVSRDPGGVEFLAVLDKDIARTEKEAGVGSRVTDVVAKHGPLFSSRSFASDPRVIRTKSMPGLQFIDRRGTVEAVVVTRPPPADEERAGDKCAAAKAEIDEAKIVAVAKVDGKPVLSRGCFTGSEPEVLVSGKSRVVVVSAGDKPRRVAAWSARGLVYARALEVDGDDRDEVVAITESRTSSSLVVTADLLKVDPGRFTSLERQRVYQLGSTEASWGISDVELLIEARARGGLVTIFGLYLRKNLLQAEEVLPLEAVPVVVRKRRPASPEPTVDAGVPPADGGPGSTTSPQ